MREGIERLETVSAGFPRIEALHAAIDPGAPRYDADGVSERARPCLDHWLELTAAERKKAGAGAVAEHAVGQRKPVADAPELASWEAWSEATDDRREAVARRVLGALGNSFAFEGLRTYVDVPIAVFRHRRKKIRMSLLPGGEVVCGLSEQEEQAIRTQKAELGLDKPYEELGQLLDALGTMRPAHTVAVGPMLVGQAPGEDLEIAKLGRWLSRGPFRDRRGRGRYGGGIDAGPPAPDCPGATHRELRNWLRIRVHNTLLALLRRAIFAGRPTGRPAPFRASFRGGLGTGATGAGSR